MNVIKQLRVKVAMDPIHFGNDIHDEISKKAITQLAMREIENVGLITFPDKVIDISGGEIQHSGLSYFDVIVSCQIYQPPKSGEVIESKVLEVSFHGFTVSEPVETFINTESKPTV